MQTGSPEHDHIFRKCAWRLIPFILVVYFVNYLDRVNVGFAALSMNEDLDFSPAVYGLGAGMLFLGYFLFQIPGNLIMQRVGARRWIFTIMIVWGLISSSTVFIQGPTSFYIVRFTLGVAEAGFYPGMLLYLTYWFPQAYLARFTASFMTGIPLAFIIGSPLSGLILQMDGIGGFRGWQWLFLIEGLPACALAFAALKVLPDGPAHASWLTSAEKAVITEQVRRSDTGEKRDLMAAMIDPRVLAIGVVLVGGQFGLYGVQLWLPLIVQGMGYSTFSTSFIVILPFVVGMIAMILWGRSSDMRGERFWHIALASLLAAAGLIVAAIAPTNVLVLIGLSLSLAGTLSIPGPLFSLPSKLLSGAAAAGAIALVNMMGTLGRFFGPYVVGLFREESESYSSGMFALAVGLVISAVLIVVLGRVLSPRATQVPQEAPR